LRSLVLLLLLSSVAACASAPVIPPELRRSAGAVVLLDGPPPVGFRLIQQVEGLSCEKNLYGGGPSMAAARESLKLEAARRGGTVVGNIFCREEGTSFGDNCWKSFHCSGDAGTLAPPTPPPPTGTAI